MIYSAKVEKVADGYMGTIYLDGIQVGASIAYPNREQVVGRLIEVLEEYKATDHSFIVKYREWFEALSGLWILYNERYTLAYQEMHGLITAYFDNDSIYCSMSPNEKELAVQAMNDHIRDRGLPQLMISHDRQIGK